MPTKRKLCILPEPNALNVRCSGKTHTILLLGDGRLKLVNHPSLREEMSDARVFVTLGGEAPKCLRILEIWRYQSLRFQNPKATLALTSMEEIKRLKGNYLKVLPLEILKWRDAISQEADAKRGGQNRRKILFGELDALEHRKQRAIESHFKKRFPRKRVTLHFVHPTSKGRTVYSTFSTARGEALDLHGMKTTWLSSVHAKGLHKRTEVILDVEIAQSNSLVVRALDTEEWRVRTAVIVQSTGEFVWAE